MSLEITPAIALATLEPGFFDTLSDQERAVLPYFYDLWLRPEQRIPAWDWRYYGNVCGRGFGKSFAISVELNGRVERGEAKSIALMGPTEPRCKEVQIDFLISTSPPWFRAEHYDGGIVWPNGVQGLVFSAEAPDRPRSGNFDHSWCCELVDWPSTLHDGLTTREQAWNNITTATRVGRSQVFWDTTSKGQNELILKRLAEHESDPLTYPIQRGAMFDNPLLSAKYLKAECKKYTGRQFAEEILGMVFSESAGALWQAGWIAEHRRPQRPANPRLRLVSIDPALSKRIDADETGLVVGSTDERGEVYQEEDLSKRMAPEEWGDLAVSQCADNGAAGVIIERNHLGDNAAYVIKSRASNRGLAVEILKRWTEKDCQPFPLRKPGTIYVREVVSSVGKGERANGPAVETEAGHVHIVGVQALLEQELTTYEPGSRSPNRFDAHTHLVTELRELWREAKKKDAKADVAEAIAVQAELSKRVRSLQRGRLGL